jgi:hypothetical protein
MNIALGRAVQIYGGNMVGRIMADLLASAVASMEQLSPDFELLDIWAEPDRTRMRVRLGRQTQLVDFFSPRPPREYGIEKELFEALVCHALAREPATRMMERQYFINSESFDYRRSSRDPGERERDYNLYSELMARSSPPMFFMDPAPAPFGRDATRALVMQTGRAIDRAVQEQRAIDRAVEEVNEAKAGVRTRREKKPRHANGPYSTAPRRIVL